MSAPDLPTVNVAVILREILGGGPLPRARVTFEQTAVDADGALVIAPPMTIVCDENGEATPKLWPNARGAGGTQTRVSIHTEGGRLLQTFLATVPADDCALHSILTLAPPPVVGDAERAALEAQASAASAKSYSAATLFDFRAILADADPGAGGLRLNAATLPAVTFAYVDLLDRSGNAIAGILDALATNWRLSLREGASGKVAHFRVTGPVVDGGGYRKVPLAFVAGDVGMFADGGILGMSYVQWVTFPVASANKQVVFNNGGALEGDAGLTYDKPSGALTVAGDLATGAGVLSNNAPFAPGANLHWPTTLAVGTTGAAPFYVYTNGLARWRVGADGMLTPYAANQYDVGAVGGEVRSGYFGTSVVLVDKGMLRGNLGSGSIQLSADAFAQFANSQVLLDVDGVGVAAAHAGGFDILSGSTGNGGNGLLFSADPTTGKIQTFGGRILVLNPLGNEVRFGNGALRLGPDANYSQLAGNNTNAVDVVNGSTAQALRVYETRLDGTSYARLAIMSSGGAYYVSSQFAGLGTRRDIYLDGLNIGVMTSGTLRWTFDALGHLLPAAPLVSNVGSPTSRVAAFFGANIDLSGNVTAQGTGAYSGDVTARLFQATGFASVAAGLASSGLSLWGSGVAHANIAWLPNERTFHLGTGNNATDVVDNYGWTHLRLSGNMSMGALPSAWSVAYRAVELGARGTAVWGAVDSTQLLMSRNAYYTDATGWRKSVAGNSQYMNASGSSWDFLSSASTVLGGITDWVNVATIAKAGSAIYSSLLLQDTLTVGGNVVVNGAGANYLTGGPTYTNTVFPNTTNTYALGAPNAQWSTLTAAASYSYYVYVDPGNWERFTQYWNGPEARLVTQGGGTGVAHDLAVGTEGAGVLKFVQGNVARATLNGATLSVLSDSFQAKLRLSSAGTKSNVLFESLFRGGTGGANTNWSIVHSQAAYGDLVFMRGNAEGSDPITDGAIVASLTGSGLKVLGQLNVDNPGGSNWGTFKAANAAGSYWGFTRGGTATTLGLIGSDGGGILGSGTGAKFGIRSEDDLLLLARGGNNAMTLGANALGLNIAPYDWQNACKAFDLQSYLSLYSTTAGGTTGLASNAYVNSGSANWQRKFGGFATLYQQSVNDGGHRWFSAGNGVADAVTAWTQTMLLDGAGNLTLTGILRGAAGYDVVRTNADASVDHLGYAGYRALLGVNGATYVYAGDAAGSIMLTVHTGGMAIGGTINPQARNAYSLGDASGNYWNAVYAGPAGFNAYNNYTDPGNFDRLSMFWAGGMAHVGTQAAGVGVAQRMRILSGDGVLELTDSSVTTFSLLRFGLGTGAFPALRRDGAGLSVVTADNVSWAKLQAGTLESIGAVIAATYIKSASTYTTSTIPTAATAGKASRAFLTDSTVTHAAGLGAVVVGGGSNFVPVYSDGANWRIG
jgi:hypothetical protein